MDVEFQWNINKRLDFVELVAKEMNEEVKRHLLNETQEFKDIQDDDPAMKYIAIMMKGRINKEIKRSKANN